MDNSGKGAKAPMSTLSAICSKLSPPRNLKDHLIWLVEGEMAHNSFVIDGAIWAARLQSWWCQQLGITDRTLRRYLAKAPFQTTTAHVYGVRTTLIRVGEPVAPSKRMVQRHLMNLWKKRVKKPTSKDFGLMAGLIDEWGLEKAPSILGLVIDQWAGFMAGVKIEMEVLGDKGQIKYFTYPTLTVVRRFASVGAEMYLMQQQDKIAKLAKQPTAQQKGVHPVFWS
ncbi:MAG: hypothetical protein ABS75_21995 [Pelagibacterium sp. SCN 63-23]|nr:MAG: hypothetical protein ABS75_21995 [Pelagibacterium sp. SCN 63-23]